MPNFKKNECGAISNLRNQMIIFKKIDFSGSKWRVE